MLSPEPAKTWAGLAETVTVGGWFGGGGGGLPPKCRTNPVEARKLFCLLSPPSLNLVISQSAWMSLMLICLLALRSMPPPTALANAFSENERLKKAEPVGMVPA